MCSNEIKYIILSWKLWYIVGHVHGQFVAHCPRPKSRKYLTTRWIMVHSSSNLYCIIYTCTAIYTGSCVLDWQFYHVHRRFCVPPFVLQTCMFSYSFDIHNVYMHLINFWSFTQGYMAPIIALASKTIQSVECQALNGLYFQFLDMFYNSTIEFDAEETRMTRPILA